MTDPPAARPKSTAHQQDMALSVELAYYVLLSDPERGIHPRTLKLMRVLADAILDRAEALNGPMLERPVTAPEWPRRDGLKQ